MFLIFFGFGLIVGSFLNAVIFRLHTGESFMTGRSHCATCDKELAARDLVPVFSYLYLGGRCRFCKKKISLQYPAIELFTGLVFGLLAVKAGLDFNGILFAQMAFVSLFIVIAVFDLKHYLILDKVVFPALALAIMLDVYWDVTAKCGASIHCHTAGGILAAIIISGFFFLQYAISGGRWIGFGDVKLGLFLGAVLGFPLGLLGLFMGYLLGAITGVGLIAIGKKSMSSRLPFGTFLCLSAILTMLYGQPILDWYLRLLGY